MCLWAIKLIKLPFFRSLSSITLLLIVLKGVRSIKESLLIQPQRRLEVVRAKMLSFRIIIILLALTIAAVESTKVIYVSFRVNPPVVVEGGIIVAPPEKVKCKDERTPDRNNKCRRVVEFWLKFPRSLASRLAPAMFRCVSGN